MTELLLIVGGARPAYRLLSLSRSTNSRGLSTVTPPLARNGK